MAKRPPKSPARIKAPREIELKPPARPLPASRARSVRFADIVGQDRAIAALRSAVASGRIHHAWIFHGPAGVGKFTTALAFAGLVLDPTSQPDLAGQIEPDPASRTQQLLASGAHPDLHIITKELAAVSRVAAVRDSKQRNIAKAVLEEFLIEPATRTRGSATESLVGRVFIIDEAELIEPIGQNTLLKTLEEPPPGCVIILVTAQDERLLPTIRSRAQRVAFPPLSPDDMARWLRASTLDTAALDDASRQWLLAFAAGSPGAARLALETNLLAWHNAIQPMLADLDRGRFPLDFAPTAAKLADDWAAAWVERPDAVNASKEAANRAAARQMLRLIAQHYRARLRAAAADRSHPEAIERATTSIELIRDAERQADSNVQIALVLESLAAQLAHA